MNPKAFPSGRAAHGAEEPEVIDMSLGGPDAPKEAGANARSPSLTRTMSPEGRPR